jgi:hypothetical protein
MQTEGTTTSDPQNDPPPKPLAGDRYLPFNGKTFPWGPVVAIHEISDYQIVEYLQDHSGHRDPRAWEGHGERAFHPYIDGKDTCMSALTLDSALIGVIGCRREGPNGTAAYYFERMTRVE